MVARWLIAWLTETLWPSIRSGSTVVGLVLAVPFVVLVALMPLSVLLLLLPVVLRDEAVLTDATARAKSFTQEVGRVLFFLAVGLSALVALTVFPIEAFSWQQWTTDPGWSAAKLAGFLGSNWQIIILTIYGLDLLFLVGLGQVPLKYNLRNLAVRWRTTAMTALAFTVVVGLLMVMLAFVRGMERLTETTGKPGNVFVMSDGAVDEAFSNLGYSDIAGKIERQKVPEDRRGLPAGTPGPKLDVPVEVRKAMIDGEEKLYMSQETLAIVNMQIPNSKKRRFVQVRGVDDAVVSAAVHDIELLPGGQWFPPTGEKKVVLGEGIAKVFGGDIGKPILEPGDTFPLGRDMWTVSGVMKADGSTFGSEVWTKQVTVATEFRKEATTTCVLRVADHPTLSPDDAGQILSVWLRTEFSPKVNATPEVEYYAKLGAASRQFSIAIWFVAVFMAIGGVFGIMNTMFAAIAQRTKDIGVLRVLGFKRWQVLVSFMLESLGIALVGGLCGIAVGSLCHGWQASSIISSGQGGGKGVVLKLTVDSSLILSALVFTLVMGRLGGLVPALSAMRLKILDALR